MVTTEGKHPTGHTNWKHIWVRMKMRRNRGLDPENHAGRAFKKGIELFGICSTSPVKPSGPGGVFLGAC